MHTTECLACRRSAQDLKTQPGFKNKPDRLLANTVTSLLSYFLKVKFTTEIQMPGFMQMSEIRLIAVISGKIPERVHATQHFGSGIFKASFIMSLYAHWQFSKKGSAKTTASSAYEQILSIYILSIYPLYIWCRLPC